MTKAERRAWDAYYESAPHITTDRCTPFLHGYHSRDALVARLMKQLERVEWSRYDEDGEFWACPSCGQRKPMHAHNCTLAATIREAKGE